MPKVSVIIPVYGVEKYIERCARSLFEQTLDDIEYLFIDDCTPDRSIEILKSVLEEYPNRKSQVIIHRMEQNSGQAAVRKWGMLNATGDYVIHCDSDDWVDTDMYRAMYEKAVGEDADIVVCDYCETDGIECGYRKRYKGCGSINKKELINNMLENIDSWAVWNKLCRRKLYDNTFIYPAASMGEDMVITLQLVWKSSTISYVPQPLYFYYYNPLSITKKKKVTSESVFNIFSQRRKNTDLVIQYISSMDVQSFVDKLIIQKWTVKKMLWSCVFIPKYRKLWKETYRDINFSLLFSKYISKKEKEQFVLTLLFLYPFKNNRIVE